MRKVFELCRLAEPDRLAKRYSTIWALKALRDVIAHGKIQTFSQNYAHSVREQPPFFLGRFDKLVSRDRHLKRSRTPTPLPVFSTQQRDPTSPTCGLGRTPFAGRMVMQPVYPSCYDGLESASVRVTREGKVFQDVDYAAHRDGIRPKMLDYAMREVGESGFGLIPGFAYTAPYEDITLKAG